MRQSARNAAHGTARPGPACYHGSVTPDGPEPSPATVLMTQAAGGDRAAADRLLPLVYEQLRKAAQLQMAGERRDHTLSATALVHEAYLRLVGPRDVAWTGRAHFYTAAAEAMRRILIDRARARHGRNPDARAAHLRALEITGLGSIALDADGDGILALDEALGRLEGVDPQAAAVVRLRFYAGMEIDQAGAVLGISPRTVKRAWAFARAWLRTDLEGQGGS